MQALISEGFEDTLQQMVMYRKGTNYGLKIVESCHFISNFLGMNVTFTENENEEEFEISDDEDSEEYDEEDSEDYDEETTEN
ncbi:hypothetical protein BLNAU_3823 [Blattamonas nauphoetae]|uniref:Uncharacterized protein n=1 Tax=Blattamonas nauphoetae TaxID=2049346 RepID=A0ABQ9YBJ1_9EUKA|nr:hypothetical protein BLNAU_3823 [Blattamonas nauphoetae]